MMIVSSEFCTASVTSLRGNTFSLAASAYDLITNRTRYASRWGKEEGEKKNSRDVLEWHAAEGGQGRLYGCKLNGLLLEIVLVKVMFVVPFSEHLVERYVFGTVKMGHY
jgi:hypothetical protein